MKIAIDARFYGLENGGLGRYTINLVSELQKQDKLNNYVLLLRESWYKNLSLPNNFSKVLVTSRHYSLKEQIEVVRILRKIKPDLTHFLHFNVPVFYNGNYIVTIHDLLMHTGIGKEATTLSPVKYMIKRLGYRKVFDHAVKHAQKILVPTNFVKDEVLSLYNLPTSKIEVIYEGVTNLKKDDHSSDFEKIHGKYFLYAGNAYPHKNLRTLIKAIKYIDHDVKLILVIPRDTFLEKIKNEIHSSSAENKVLVKSKVSDAELFYLYKNSLAFVYPSFSEGFGLQGLEAMKVGTRLIASDIQVFHEIYKDYPEYFNPNDFEDLATILEKIVLEKATVRLSKIKNAQKYTESFSWAKMTEKVISSYKKALPDSK